VLAVRTCSSGTCSCGLVLVLASSIACPDIAFRGISVRAVSIQAVSGLASSYISSPRRTRSSAICCKCSSPLGYGAGGGLGGAGVGGCHSDNNTMPWQRCIAKGARSGTASCNSGVVLYLVLFVFLSFFLLLFYILGHQIEFERCFFSYRSIATLPPPSLPVSLLSFASYLSTLVSSHVFGKLSVLAVVG